VEFGNLLQRLPKWPGVYAIRKRKRELTRIHDDKLIKVKVGYGAVHRFGGARGFGVFEFNPQAPTTANQQQIQLGPGVGRPEIRLRVIRHCQDLFDTEALPRGTAFRMPAQSSIVVFTSNHP
jgi:hypothetical protein